MTASDPIRLNAAGRSELSRSRASEQGYILLAAIFFLALLVIALAVAAPQVAKSIQRDREVETFHRGMQYRRAVQLYYRKFHAYPPNTDALVKTNLIRFLRKKYIDPMTGKDDWKPILYGQNKTPTAMGFFGQPLSGNASTIAGVGPSGGNGLNGISPTGAMSMSGGFLSGSNNDFFSSSNSPNGATTPTPGTSGGAPAQPETMAAQAGTQAARGLELREPAHREAPVQAQALASPDRPLEAWESSAFRPPAQNSPSWSTKKNHYNEWEFTYDPLSDIPAISGGNTGSVGQPASSTTSPAGSSTSGSSIFGSSGVGGTGSGSVYLRLKLDPLLDDYNHHHSPAVERDPNYSAHLQRFSNSCEVLKGVQGGFFSMKKPLERAMHRGPPARIA